MAHCSLSMCLGHVNVALVQCIDGVVARLVNTIDHHRVIMDANVQFHHLTPDSLHLIHRQLGHSKGQQRALYFWKMEQI